MRDWTALLAALALFALAVPRVARASSPQATPLTMRARLVAAVDAHDLGDLDAAERGYRDLAGEGYVRARIGLGILLRERGEFAESLTLLEDARAPYEVGVTLTAMEEHELAAVAYARVLSEDPQTWFNLGSALTHAGRDVRAVFENVAARTLTSDPTHVYSCAALAAYAGDIEDANELLAEAVTLEGG